MLKPQEHIELLRMLWNFDGPREYLSESGETVIVRKRGEYDESADRFKGAEIEAGGRIYCGEVVIWAGKYPPMGDYESVILHVAPHPSSSIRKNNGTSILQVISHPDPVCCAAYETLKEGRKKIECSRHIARLESHQRVALMTRLLIDRLKRKSDEIKELYEKNHHNWNEAMYVTLMVSMGSPNNKEAYRKLAFNVPYHKLIRERNTPQYVESMLLGASGLLELYDSDSYIRTLKSNFNQLQRKHTISPLMAGEWKDSQNFPSGSHTLRLAQISAFIATRDFLFDNIIRCRTVEDLQKIFRAEASDYWSTHYRPGKVSSYNVKRIGYEKANVLGINTAIPLIFTYGDYMKEQSIKDEAVELLEKIGCEQNYIINGWKKGGVIMESAFDSQAIIQLNNEYCGIGACWKCPVGKKIVKEHYHPVTAQ